MRLTILSVKGLSHLFRSSKLKFKDQITVSMQNGGVFFMYIKYFVSWFIINQGYANCTALLLGLLVKDDTCFSTYRIQINLFLESKAEQNYQLPFCKYLVYSTGISNFEIAVYYLSLGFRSLLFWSKKKKHQMSSVTLNGMIILCVFCEWRKHKMAS